MSILLNLDKLAGLFGTAIVLTFILAAAAIVPLLVFLIKKLPDGVRHFISVLAAAAFAAAIFRDVTEQNFYLLIYKSAYTTLIAATGLYALFAEFYMLVTGVSAPCIRRLAGAERGNGFVGRASRANLPDFGAGGLSFLSRKFSTVLIQ